VSRPDPDPALSIRFDVEVDGVELGAFTGCDGLAAQYDVYEYEEGGQNTYTHKLPGRVKFENVKLMRAVDANSGRLASWFTSLSKSVERKTAKITAYDGNRKAIATWSLVGVWPAKYTGPSFEADGSGVAIETLELAHHGFRLS